MKERELFECALELAPGPARDEFLARECQHDTELHRRISELIRTSEGNGEFLERPAFEIPTSNIPPVTEGAGSQVGPYRLLQRIGEGGFGVVYMAEQIQPVRRKVALKIIKPGMDTKEVIARFESERQALALMDHPNIARVLDAGATDSGRPYFVMELVKGVPITEFCDRNHLSIEQRMELFVPVCLAVQHAHHKGVIHRDIKPSNVMVTLHDGRPVPKVIDFGVAKATSQQLTQRTLFTAYGQMIGTPVYMSPEQAEMSGLDIDTRSDIYSLGVLLYELLTGTTPLELERLRQVGLIEMQRLIRDVDAPPPSTRLSTLSKEASIVFTNRSTDPRRLAEKLKGDVDWIVMKALEKDRQRRYDTPTAFADDVLRFLKHEAIHARPPSSAYRLRKFVQRNKGLAAGIGAVAGTLLIGAAVSTAFAVYANSQLERALDAERGIQVSLIDAEKAKKGAEDQRRLAEEERDRAVKAELAQKESAQLAEQRRLETEQSRMAEKEQRELADQQRSAAEQQKEAAVQLSKDLAASVEKQRQSIYAAEMNLVRIEAQRGNHSRVREILLEQLPIRGEKDLRGFEWHYWYKTLTQARVLLRLENYEHGKTGAGAALLPGGLLLAIGQGQQTEIRDIASGRTSGTLPVILGRLVNRHRWSRTGRTIDAPFDGSSAFHSSRVTVSPGCNIVDVSGESRSFTYPSRPDSSAFSHVSFLNISPDGSRAAALGIDPSHSASKPACRIVVWNVDSGEVLLDQIQARELNRFEFSPDGSLIAAHVCHSSLRSVSQQRDAAVVIEVATGKEIGRLRHNDDIDSVFWLPDQKRLLVATLGFSGSNRRDLLSWTIDEGHATKLSNESMPDYVQGAVSPDGRFLAVTGHTSVSIRLLDTLRGELVRTFVFDGAAFESVSFSQDGRRLVASSTRGEVLTWDLTQNADLFELASRPLPQLAVGGHALSLDQSLLAVVRADGAVVVRQRDGGEQILKPGARDSWRRFGTLVLSDDGKLLATQAPAPFPRRSERRGAANESTSMLELYDVATGRRLWQAVQPSQRLSWNTERNPSMVFTHDGGHLVIATASSFTVMKCATGEAERRESGPAPYLMANGLTQRANDRRLLTAGVLVDGVNGSPGARTPTGPLRATEVSLIDVMSWEPVVSSRLPGAVGIEDARRSFVARPIPSPDGIHVGAVQIPRNLTEIWNLESEQKVVSADGRDVRFTADGRRAAILQYHDATSGGSQQSNSGGTQPSNWIRHLSVWQLPEGQELCQISLAGNPADRIRFSPDGRRLLTLHGYDYGDSVRAIPAQGRLWDVESGRELLSIPVADVNHYEWEMVFDPSGMKITSILLGKANGTGSGGNSVVYDAAPLSPEDDADLVARELVTSLASRTPAPEEIRAEVDARTGLNPRVRQKACDAIARLGANADQIAKTVQAIVVNRSSSPAQFQKALRWAGVLHLAEPASVRSRALLGAAQFRAGLTNEAKVTLGELQADRTTLQSTQNNPYEILRMAILAQITQRMDEQGVLLKYRELASHIETVPDDIRRVLFELPRPSSDEGTSRSAMLEDETELATQFQKADRNQDRILKEEDSFWGTSSSWAAYRPFDRNQDGGLDLQEYINCRKAVWLTSNSINAGPDVVKRLENLTEALKLSPDYVTALNERAWVYATSTDDSYRNASQAVADATRANELGQWKSSWSLDALAAALAAQEQFDAAIKHQSKAIELASPEASAAYKARLALYQQRKPFRTSSSQQRASATANHIARSYRYDAPLLAPEHTAQFRRMVGFGASWSADSRRLIRNLDVRAMERSRLEIFDRETGETTTVVDRAFDPAWSRLPNGPIAFVRRSEERPGDNNVDELWLADADGANIRKISRGGFPIWTDDGRLFFRAVNDDRSFQLVAVTPEKSEDRTISLPLGHTAFPAVSRDGTLYVRIEAGRLSVRRMASGEELVSTPLEDGDRGSADFSPDGRLIAYGSWLTANPGVWLIEVSTGRRRRLADCPGAMPRWSPDGKFIAVDDRPRNEILILDVSTLDFSNGLQGMTPVALVSQPSLNGLDKPLDKKDP